MPRRRCGPRNQGLHERLVYKAMRGYMQDQPNKPTLRRQITPKRKQKARAGRSNSAAATGGVDGLAAFLTAMGASKNDRGCLLRLSRRERLMRGYDRFLDCDALLAGFRVGTLKYILNMNHDELIDRYLMHVNDLWDLILHDVDNNPRARLDVNTVEELQLLAPGLSQVDSTYIERLFEAGEVPGEEPIFPHFDLEEHQQIRKNMRHLNHIILDVSCLPEDCKVLWPAIRYARAQNKLAKRASPETLISIFDQIENHVPTVVQNRVVQLHDPVDTTPSVDNTDQHQNRNKLGSVSTTETELVDEPHELREGRPDRDWVQRRRRWRAASSSGHPLKISPDTVRHSKLHAFFEAETVATYLAERSKSTSPIASSWYASNSSMTHERNASATSPSASELGPAADYRTIIGHPYFNSTPPLTESANSSVDRDINTPRQGSMLDLPGPRETSLRTQVATWLSGGPSATMDTDADHMPMCTAEDEVVEPITRPLTPPQYSATKEPIERGTPTDSHHLIRYELSVDGHWVRGHDISEEEWHGIIQKEYDNGTLLLFHPQSSRTKTFSTYDVGPGVVFLSKLGRPVAARKLQEEAMMLYKRHVN